MDFSAAERGGCIDAFIAFWSGRPDDSRTTDELHNAAQKILRGCQEHFRAGVTRVSRINGVIPPESQSVFQRCALGLLNASSSEDFRSRVSLLIRDFPLVKPWISWWDRDAIASMLFESERRMDAEIWESLPSTTNAQESIHNKYYAACGRDHGFFDGLKALFAYAVHSERLFFANASMSNLSPFSKYIII